nr:MAG TPA: anaerobic ribonucleoside triphosphate reductase [Bacteriophage sp.]
MNDFKVIKKDGTSEGWNWDKIKVAIDKAKKRANVEVPEWRLWQIEGYIEGLLWRKTEVTTEELHKLVIDTLNQYAPEVGKSYQEYRDYKNTYAKAFESVKNEADTVLLLGDKENANFDSSLISTKGSLIKGYLTKELYKQFYLSKEEKELVKRGDIYIHDLRDMIFNSFNCCLFDIGTVLKGGFEMSNVKYTEPNSVLSALQVIGDITLVATAQQFGGFTLAEIDKVLLPYAKKTFHKAFYKYFSQCYLEHDESCAMALQDLTRELEQGFQSLELKLNTVPCSRGDFAFTTLTFGTWDTMMDYEDQEIMKLIGETILKTRMKGHGGKQVVFPKLVFLYDGDKIKEDEYHRELFELAVQCSSKCMYPDYLSLNHGKVADIYKRTGAITSPMGCRAYLTEWHDPKTNEAITIGRCNIGAVSLNLPLIWKVAENENKNFFDVLSDRMEVIREFLKKRYDALKHTKACTNPMCFTQGGLHNGFLNPDDEIGDLVNYMTASFGITALNELSILATGKTLKEDRSFATVVVDVINDKIEEFKEEDGYLYALYGTPAESLCGTQARQYREYTGDNQFGDYFTNSFHLHVSEDVTPIEKQDEEYELFHKCNGGHIQYVRLDNPSNIDAVKALIKRGMSMGFYQGVNFDAAYCEDCGKHSTNVGNTCPHCGSHNLSVISRVCGYLGYSNVNGKSRMNDAKMSEIADRVSM